MLSEFRDFGFALLTIVFYKSVQILTDIFGLFSSSGNILEPQLTIKFVT